MIILNLKGGLGNQMFQYAAGLNLSILNNCDLILDDSFFSLNQNKSKNDVTPRDYELGIFSNIRNPRKKPENSLFKSLFRGVFNHQLPIVRQKTVEFDQSIFDYTPPYVLDGYWQSEKYFSDNASSIKEVFSFDYARLDYKNLEILNKIKSCNSVSIHVRRGDYLHPSVRSLHGVCSLDYYRAAISFINEKVDNPIFYIFSDDSLWVREKLVPLIDNCKIILNNNLGPESWKDMLLQSECNYNITANSTFSWWAAWLNKNNQKIVIAPQVWFLDSRFNSKDRIPNDWLLF